MKKVKMWDNILLLETSVVGIAAYPDAHLSLDEFSLIKALNSSYDYTTEKEVKAEMEDKEVAKTEVPEIKKEEVKEVEIEKKLSNDEIQKMIAETVKSELEQLKPKRGLVETPKVEKKLGELLFDAGLFRI